MSLRKKLAYLRLNFSWKSKASNLRQPKLSASYIENVPAIFLLVNVTFLTWKSLKKLKYSWSPAPLRPPPTHTHFLKFLKKKNERGVQIFPTKMEGGVNKIGGVLKRGAITYFQTNLFQCYLSLSAWCVSVSVSVCVLFIYTIFISIICVSKEEPSLTRGGQNLKKRR